MSVPFPCTKTHIRNTIPLPPDGAMRLTKPCRSRDFGRLHIHEEIRVVELDAGGTAGDGDSLERRAPVRSRAERSQNTRGASGAGETVCCPWELLHHVLEQMVIIVPCKNEEVEVIKHVVAAIPASCLVILASNCERRVHDRYVQQVEMLKTFDGSPRQILAVHQKDVGAAAAFKEAGMPELIDPVDGTIRDGKGEGMLLGTAIAAAFFPERRYVGFIDADNFYPNSVNEYCRAFAAGLALSQPPELEHTMVRLHWSSKPKFQGGQLVFVREGRCSRIVNSWLNKLFASGAGLVSTGNAGEHAMTMDLAVKLRMAAGYAIEPFHFTDLLERSGHCISSGKQHGMVYSTPGHRGNTNGARKTPQPFQKSVRVLQIRTLSPHFHRASDKAHIRSMWAAGLGAVYHHLSHLPSGETASGSETIRALRKEMHSFAAEHGGIDPRTGELPRPIVYPALDSIDMERFRKVLGMSGLVESLWCFGLASGNRIYQ
ncbi:Mannosyl-3-phosphoglycerate synthase [Madurella mycetomatis]|uniref:Mannosyl-3-phosphoglycerate synthase n=1 Tax=Madurella mycetomatis TaxID=100816 RepID=A0A175WG86_9PEZI|nr:Mannosyl-3-phosphoglycerate synthase [Madurella mycetomatis]